MGVSSFAEGGVGGGWVVDSLFSGWGMQEMCWHLFTWGREVRLWSLKSCVPSRLRWHGSWRSITSRGGRVLERCVRGNVAKRVKR